MSGLTGRSAVVTGGSAGIGAATVLALAEQGTDTAFCARGAEAVEALVERAKGLPGRVLGFPADLADAQQTQDFLVFVDEKIGKVDILVNNVGASPSRNFLFLSDDDWESTLQLNLMSAVRCTRHLLPGMRKQKWGRVIMVGTGGAKHPSASLIDYCASKAALVATSKALARKYAADNVLVNSLLPGLIHTSMWDRAATEISEASGSTNEEVFASLSKQVPLGRYGTAEEVANIILFLCSDAANYIAGAAIEVDGALSTTTF